MFLSPEDLDKVVEEGDASSVEGEEKASSKVAARQRQRRALSEGSDDSGADDAEPDSAAGEIPLLQVSPLECSKNFLESRTYAKHCVEPLKSVNS